MRKSPWLLALAVVPAFLFSSHQAVADPWKDESGKGRHKYEYKEEYGRHGEYRLESRYGDCKYEYKSGPGGSKEERKCGPGIRFAGGPPPWAPAHGYRAKHGGPGLPRLPIDLDAGRCNRELLGSLLGAAAGAAIGSQIGDGRGQLAAVAGGTLLGFLVGGRIGREMDALDQHCIGQALEHAPDGQAITWRNPEASTAHEVTPVRTYRRGDGRYCREYRTTSVIGGKPQQVYGTACRQPDGSWELVS